MGCMKNSNFGAAVYSAFFSYRNEPANHLTQVLFVEHVVIKYTWCAWVSQNVLQDTKKESLTSIRILPQDDETNKKIAHVPHILARVHDVGISNDPGWIQCHDFPKR